MEGLISKKHNRNEFDPKQYVEQLVMGIQDPVKRAQRLLESQIHVGVHKEVTNGVIAFTQQMIEEEQSWEALQMNKAQLFQQLRYEGVIKPAIEQYTRTNSRKVRFLSTIEEHWGALWKEELDPRNEMLPSYLSEHLLASFRRIAKFSEHRPNYIGQLISEEISLRVDNRRGGKRKTSLATVVDLIGAEKRAMSSPKQINSIPFDSPSVKRTRPNIVEGLDSDACVLPKRLRVLTEEEEEEEEEEEGWAEEEGEAEHEDMEEEEEECSEDEGIANYEDKNGGESKLTLNDFKKCVCSKVILFRK